MRRLPALIGKTFWPLAFAQRTFCAAEIRARAAADIFRRGLDDPVLYVPAKAASAAFSPFNCRATLSLSAFISAIMSMCSPRARIVANNNRRLRDSLHQLEEHAQCLVSAAIDLPAIASYHSLTDGHAVTTRRPDHFALLHRRETRWWRDGCGLQGGGCKTTPLCCPEVLAG